MTHLRSIFIVASLAAFVSLGASTALAFTIFDTGKTGGNPPSSLIGVNITPADVGDSFEIDWLVGSSALGTPDELSAFASYSVTSLSDSLLTIEMTLHNTTVLSSTLTNAAILSAGFGVNPNAAASFSTSGRMLARIGDGAGPRQIYPGGFKAIDVCIYSQNCSGGGVSRGIQAGGSDTVRIQLAGDFSRGDVNLLYFPLKFQTNNGSFEPAGSYFPASEGYVDPEGSVASTMPEPTAALLFVVGVLLLRRSVARRR